MSEYKNKDVTITYIPDQTFIKAKYYNQDNEIAGKDSLYKEQTALNLFSPVGGWNNDPNGFALL